MPQMFQTASFLQRFHVREKLGPLGSKHGDILPMGLLAVTGGCLWFISYPALAYLGPIYERRDMEKHAATSVD